MLLEKDAIIDALHRLGALAAERGVELEFVLLGGAAMVLAYSARASTHDVDIAPIGLHATWRPLATQVAVEFEWPEDWLNDAAKGFYQGNERGDLLLETGGLRIYQPCTEQLLAMKLMAWRDDQDIGDARVLLNAINLNDMEVGWNRVVPFLVPGSELKARYAFEDLWETRHD